MQGLQVTLALGKKLMRLGRGVAMGLYQQADTLRPSAVDTEADPNTATLESEDEGPAGTAAAPPEEQTLEEMADELNRETEAWAATRRLRWPNEALRLRNAGEGRRRDPPLCRSPLGHRQAGRRLQSPVSPDGNDRDSNREQDEEEDDVVMESHPLEARGASDEPPDFSRREIIALPQRSLLTTGLRKYARKMAADDGSLALRERVAISSQSKLARVQEEAARKIEREGEKTRIPAYMKPEENLDWGFEMTDAAGCGILSQTVVPVYLQSKTKD